MAFPKPTPSAKLKAARTLRPVKGGVCKACGKALVRTIYQSGVIESAVNFERRRFCSHACVGAYGRASHDARTKPCVRCGKPLAPSKPYAIRRRSFCSRLCSDAWVRENNPRRSKCVVCGAQRLGGTVPGKTCSAKCGYLLRKSQLRDMRPCDWCHVEYWPGAKVRTKFCSRKCQNASRHERPAFLRLACEVCGASFRRTRAAVARTKRAFCGQVCARRFYRGANSPLYRGGKDPNRGGEWNRIAASIRERDAYSCRRCGISEAENGQKLSVDHIRPWRSFDDKAQANDPSNLVALCRPCHATKTTSVERAWLRGDVVAFQQWVRSLVMESARRSA